MINFLSVKVVNFTIKKNSEWSFVFLKWLHFVKKNKLKFFKFNQISKTIYFKI